MNDPDDPTLEQLMARRRFIRTAAAGTVVSALGASWLLSDALTGEARAATRADGRPRLPPGQRALARLKPMGGDAGDPSPGGFRLRVHGAVERPFTLTFQQLLAESNVTLPLDVHCVTGWSVLGASFTGLRLRALLERAGLRREGRYVVFEAAHGYTANVPLSSALAPSVLVAHRLDGRPLSRAHGAPVRAIVPDLYFWKSAKWLTGVRVVTRDEPGYWERRGYHNRADPWREERHA
ncbi:MAG: molybdopterin-dependent oxidoreductase [Polyangiaceae bacterium]|nr:molybdopterin-dependent oxidoreductase [Polyangiaceae bacterium]